MNKFSHMDEDVNKKSIGSLSQEEKQVLWGRIDGSIDAIPQKRRRVPLYRLSAAAVACVGLIFGVIFLLNFKTGEPVQQIKMLVFETGMNQRTQLVLPDSTVIWLNGSSKVEYPEVFTGNSRRVKLEGEAFFAVYSDTRRPFVVQTPRQSVKVLGTQFNVKAFGDEAQVETTLVEGKVSIQLDQQMQKTILTPNQQAVLIKETGDMTVKEVDTRLFTAWMVGHYKFDTEPFAVIARHFEKLYGVTFVFKTKSAQMLSYTGTFRYEQSLEEVLMLLKNTKHFNYSIKANEVTIY